MNGPGRLSNMSDINDSLEESDEDVSRGIDVELGAVTVRRVGMVMQYLGAAGAMVWVFETYSTWDALKGQGFSDGGFSHKLLLLLGPFGTLLSAGLVIGVGSACRLMADWTVLRLADDDHERPDVDPLPEP